MRTSWINLVTVLTLCSASALGGCATDDADTSDDAANATITSDPLTGEDNFAIVKPDGITVNLSVRQWQTDMNAWIQFFGACGPALAVDGSFGPRTTAATRCFQGVHGLTQDGIVGPQTLRAMCADLNVMGRTDLRNASNCN